ncbi:unnamed protein product [Effrenium voratum]|uniref:Pentatricopeptide repeat-containing protein, chloroplastic n=1 Tax=Effrenium voratum TaxID=2562239 RepID=A0AA36MUU9_9DINO|nr:unnamed protein product [Effrenium voratum]
MVALALLAGQISLDVVCYNSGISACASAFRWQAAVALLVSAIATARPDVVSFNSAISAADKASQWQEALGLLKALGESGLLPDVISYNAAISACEKASRWQLAMCLFWSLPCASLPFSVVSYGAALAACPPGESQLLLRMMRSARVRPNLVHYGAAISRSHWRMSIWLLGCMRLDQLTADVITLNSAMSSCQGEKQWQTSLLLQSERPLSTCSPATYSSAIGACDASHWWLAAALSARMRHETVEPNALSCAAVMSSWADAARWESALSCTEFAGLALHLASCNAAITCCLKGGHWQLGLRILHSMQKAQLSPDVVSYTAVMSACRLRGKWRSALVLVQIMEEKAVLLNTLSYTAAIGCQPWRLAVRLAFGRGLEGLEGLDVTGWSAAMGSCQRAHRWLAALRLFARVPSADAAALDAAAAAASGAAVASVPKWLEAAGREGTMAARAAVGLPGG